MAPVDKLILFCRSSIEAKYGASAAVANALDALVQADAGRGLHSTCVAVDDDDEMALAGASPVSGDVPLRSEYKRVVDELCHSLTPAYLLLIGSEDLFPYQRLDNPLFLPYDDGDEFILSDLPYASDQPYSTRPEDFRGPIRVVGRIPDLGATSTPDHLVALLGVATSWTSNSSQYYCDAFGIAAASWPNATAESMRVFAGGGRLSMSPPEGPHWALAEMQRPSHFINCHGRSGEENYWGDGETVLAHLRTAVFEGAKLGTVVAAECCYGAEPYDSLRRKPEFPIAHAYLARGAYGFFGSTCRSFGGADDKPAGDRADLICRNFFRQVLLGRSLGASVLGAQQQFVQDRASQSGALLPHDLKTLAQFVLLGDPSIHPVASTHAQHMLLHARRANTTLLGRSLALVPAARVSGRPIPETTSAFLMDAVRTLGLRNPTLRSLDLDLAAGPALYTVAAVRTAFGDADQLVLITVAETASGPVVIDIVASK